MSDANCTLYMPDTNTTAEFCCGYSAGGVDSCQVGILFSS